VVIVVGLKSGGVFCRRSFFQMARRPEALLLWHVCLLVVVLASTASAAPSVFRFTSPSPGVQLAPIYPLTSQLYLLDANLTLDTANGYFTLSLYQIFRSQQSVPSIIPLSVTLHGNITFAQPNVIEFGFPCQDSACCSQTPSSPPVCPSPQQFYVNGPFQYGVYPLSGPTTALIIELQPYVNPVTNQAMNFLFASQALTWKCVGTCVDLHGVLPPAPLPQNASYTVRNHIDGREEEVECCEMFDDKCIVWSSFPCPC
jgi:hypothetical protein